MSDEHLREGIIFPPIPRIREITAKVAAAVVKEAVKEDNSEGYRETNARELRQIAEDEVTYISFIWFPLL
jgi:malate dehydrogenase (decarboxylating)